MEPTPLPSVNSEEESFIILSSSEPSLRFDVVRNSPPNSLKMDLERVISLLPQYKEKIEDIAPSIEGSALNFKANFKMDKQPSPESLVVARGMVSSCADTSDMQIKIGELLDENVVLRDMLKQNNVSMREQFKTISNWQDDFMKANQLHKTKFAETKVLVEKLRVDNLQLRKELDFIKIEKELHKSSVISTEASTSTPNIAMTASAFECINKDEESTIDMLTSQLELVERQRRQVIADNENLIWQKESLENVLKLTNEKNEKLKESLKKWEEEQVGQVDPELVKTLEAKIKSLQIELKNSHVKLLESENVKLEHTQHKQESQETIKQLNCNIVDLKSRLREAHTLTFQPIRYSLSLEAQCQSSEFSNFVENVKLYDKIMKDLAEYLNQHSQEYCSLYDSVSALVETYSLQENKMDVNIQLLNTDLSSLKQCVDKHNTVNAVVSHQIRSCSSALEKMFLDYQQVLRILRSEELEKSACSGHIHIIDTLTAKIVSQDESLEQMTSEISNLRKIIFNVQKESDERDLLKAQIEIYKCDFEAERDARTQMAAEKQEAISNLNIVQKRNQQLVEEMDSYRSNNAHMFINRSNPTSSIPSTSTTQMTINQTTKSESPQAVRYSCPLCDNSFKSVKMLEDHVETCLQQVA